MRRARLLSRCGLLFTVVAFFALHVVAWAQSTATIQGTVADSQGGVLPGASVVARSLATGVERTAVTDASGHFLVAALPPGRYSVEISMSGFQSFRQEFEVEVASTVLADVRLNVGTVAEQVNVSGSAPVIETSTTSVGQVISQRVVQEIPLNGRHFVDLGLLIPGR